MDMSGGAGNYQTVKLALSVLCHASRLLLVWFLMLFAFALPAQAAGSVNKIEVKSGRWIPYGWAVTYQNAYDSAGAACIGIGNAEKVNSWWHGIYVGTTPNKDYSDLLNCQFLDSVTNITQAHNSVWELSTLSCPPNSNSQGALGCVCNDGYQPAPSGKSCESLNISLELEKEVEPLKNLTLKAVVKGQDGPKGGIPVTLILDVQSTSGGHVHGESNAAVRPRGDLTGIITCPSTAPPRSVCAAGVTSSQAPYIGEAWFTFTAPAVAGTHTLSATCTDCTNTASASVDVKVPNLASLTTAPSDYVLVGGGTGKKHTDNHYLAASAKARLGEIVAAYNRAYPRGPLLRLNDASLEWGGKFDIAGKWGGEHAEHRRGVVIDIRGNLDATAIPEIRFFDFEKIAAEDGAEAELHCSKEFSKYIIGCIADSGSNRHFHVRLLGSDARF